MRRNKLVTHLILAAGIAASAPAWSIPLSDVGGLDSLLASATLGSSGEAAEESWVESVLGVDVSFDDKIDGGFAWELVAGTTDLYAQLLSTSPSYFLVKTGNGSSTGHRHFLYQNVSELSYAVIDLSNMGFDIRKTDITKVSHISEFGTPSVSVSEPASLALMGLALTGLGMAGRRRQ